MRRAWLLALAVLVAVVLLAPELTTADPLRQSLRLSLEAPSWQHPLGTDHLGRSVLARLTHGARRSFGLALATTAIATAIGLALGLIAAWRRGWTDIAIMRVSDVAMACPGLLVALLLAGTLGGGVFAMLIGLQVAAVPPIVRMTRTVAVAALASSAVETAVVSGHRLRYIVTRFVLPPVARQVVTLATLGLGSAVLAISSLGFLGLGIDPPTPELGAMIAELLPYIAEAPVQTLAPAVLIWLFVLIATVIGEHYSSRWADQR